jgi:hypothetical protein
MEPAEGDELALLVAGAESADVGAVVLASVGEVVADVSPEVVLAVAVVVGVSAVVEALAVAAGVDVAAISSAEGSATSCGISALGAASAAYSAGVILNSYSLPEASLQSVHACVPITRASVPVAALESAVYPESRCPEGVSYRLATYALVQIRALA